MKIAVGPLLFPSASDLKVLSCKSKIKISVNRTKKQNIRGFIISNHRLQRNVDDDDGTACAVRKRQLSSGAAVDG